MTRANPGAGQLGYGDHHPGTRRAGAGSPVGFPARCAARLVVPFPVALPVLVLVLAFVALLAGAPRTARAARPFVTDDARLATTGSCQLESWIRAYPASQEIWALPACNPTGNLEVTLGGGRARTDGQPATADYVLQAKTLFRTLRADDWAWGLAVGAVRHPENNPGPNLLGNVYAYLPISVSLAGEVVLVHANVGWLRDAATRADRATWGLGTEIALNGRLAAMAESFGDSAARPYWQAGLRYFIVPGLVQVDATTGHQYSGPRATRWVSLGLRFTPERMF